VKGVYPLSIVLGALGAFAVSRFAPHIGLLDCPNERSSHCAPTPKGGGVGILASFLLVSVALGLPVGFWVPLGALSMLAFWGDLRSLSVKSRLFGQLFLMALLIILSEHPLGNQSWYLPWTLLGLIFIVGTANFFNFMDGIDGIAAITALIGFALLALYIFLNNAYTAWCTVSVCISLSCLGFLPFNALRARVFMGDVGSILLGAAFASLAFLRSETFLDLVCMTSFVFPFYADELTTMAVRIKNGENLTRPHRKHLYQLLANESGVPHWKISAAYGAFQVIVGLTVLMVKAFGSITVLSLLAAYSSLFLWVRLEFQRRIVTSAGGLHKV
jgi:Fuc2NAc and GlcNAc transferase